MTVTSRIQELEQQLANADPKDNEYKSYCVEEIHKLQSAVERIKATKEIIAESEQDIIHHKAVIARSEKIIKEEQAILDVVA